LKNLEKKGNVKTKDGGLLTKEVTNIGDNLVGSYHMIDYIS
jgi:hypothetical protein